MKNKRNHWTVVGELGGHCEKMWKKFNFDQGKRHFCQGSFNISSLIVWLTAHLDKWCLSAACAPRCVVVLYHWTRLLLLSHAISLHGRQTQGTWFFHSSKRYSIQTNLECLFNCILCHNFYFFWLCKNSCCLHVNSPCLSNNWVVDLTIWVVDLTI